MAKRINKEATIQNILDKCNSSIGYSIDIKKFNEHPKTDAFLIECAEFCKVEVVVYTS
jgi:type IV secretory pathway ATPase VirB11/archaellum biosynthesis ATPase